LAKTPRARARPAPQTTAEAFVGTAALRLSRDGDVVIAALAGEIDLANARDVFGRTVAALDNRAAGLIIDLSPADYLDSSGLQALLDLANRTRIRGQSLRVVAPPESAPGRLLELVNAEALVPVDGTVPDALTAFRAAAL
jgi:anti-anti-sigma factor